eukprot:scaffold199512_cov17-Prasinocladus_malaysianus.AAC.1
MYEQLSIVPYRHSAFDSTGTVLLCFAPLRAQCIGPDVKCFHINCYLRDILTGLPEDNDTAASPSC